MEIVMKILISAAVAALASFAALAQPPGIPATSDSNTHFAGPRDPYTDGAKAGEVRRLFRRRKNHGSARSVHARRARLRRCQNRRRRK
ncbi:hypothetical protein ACU4GD_17665 [Cupriavidus basilensis]